MNFKSILEKNIAKHGIIHQKVKAMEECAELIQALAKGDKLNIAEEMADVLIMIDQLKLIFNNERLVEEFKVIKLERMGRTLRKEVI